MSGKLFVISAPSGTGKNTLVTEVLKRLSDFDISRVVTYTTRPPRNGEENEVDYNFISQEEFHDKANNGFFLESTDYASKPYGSPSSILQEIELGKSFILVIDREGAKSISQYKPITIWIQPPNIDTLKNRLKKRNTESPAQIEKRLKIAESEIAHEQNNRFYEYHIINDVFDQAVSELTTVIENELAKTS